MSHGTCGNPACGRRSPDPICWDCTHTLRDALARIGDLVELLTAAARVVRNSGDGGRGHWPPLPFEADFIEFTTALHTMLVAVVRDLGETRGIPFMPAGYASRQLVGPLPPHIRHLPADYVVSTGEIAAWLIQHLADVRMCQSAGETYIDVTRAVERGLALANGPAIPVYRGPCPTIVGRDERGRFIRCGARLYAPRGESFVECRRCKVVHDAASLEQRHMANVSEMLFRFNRLQRVLRELGEPVTDRTLSAWIRNGRIKAAGWQRPDGTITTTFVQQGDPALYRLADVRRVRAESRAVKGSTA